MRQCGGHSPLLDCLAVCPWSREASAWHMARRLDCICRKKAAAEHAVAVTPFRALSEDGVIASRPSSWAPSICWRLAEKKGICTPTTSRTCQCQSRYSQHIVATGNYTNMSEQSCDLCSALSRQQKQASCRATTAPLQLTAANCFQSAKSPSRLGRLQCSSQWQAEHVCTMGW